MPLSLSSLWVFGVGAHTWLLRRLADDSHAAAMLTTPSETALVLGALLVVTRLFVFLALPVSFFSVIAWRMGAWLFGRFGRPVDAASGE